MSFNPRKSSAGIGWADGMDDAAIKRFEDLRGVHHPYGVAIPNTIRPGQYFGDGEYMAVEGNMNQPGWGSSVAPGYEAVGQAGYYADPGEAFGDAIAGNRDKRPTIILRRKAQPAAQQTTPAPEVPKQEPVLDVGRIADAKNAAAKWKAGFESGSIPRLNTTGNPYTDAATAGYDNNKRFADTADWFKGDAMEQTAEIGAAGEYYTRKFFNSGVKVPSLKSDQDIRDQFSWYRDQIKNA